MKRILVFTASLMVAVGAFAQGQVNFNNRIPLGAGGVDTGGPQGSILAPIYGPEPGANILVHKSGNTATGYPVGGTVYGGPLLAGTGFTAQLWGGPGGAAEDALQLATLAAAGNPTATTTFRTGTTAGFIITTTLPSTAANIPNAPAGAASRATLQLRAWDNQGGTITSWAQVLLPQNALVARGASPLFTPPFDLGGGAVLPPNLIGLVSFNIAPVPEPSAIALGVLGLGTVMFLRRRKA